MKHGESAGIVDFEKLGGNKAEPEEPKGLLDTSVPDTLASPTDGSHLANRQCPPDRDS